MSAKDQLGDFEVIRETLLQMDPETRTEVIAAIKALRACPRLVAVRILAKAAVPPPMPLIVTGA